MTRDKSLRFRFSEDEACAIRDGLNTLIEVAYPPKDDREEGEQYEVERITNLSNRIGRRLGID